MAISGRDYFQEGQSIEKQQVRGKIKNIRFRKRIKKRLVEAKRRKCRQKDLP
jgi:hypothetical protein